MMTHRSPLSALKRALSECPNAGNKCVEWTGWRNPEGYGYVGFEGRDQPAHRVVYGLLVRPVPPELHVDHLCRNKCCVNPLHLEPVTPRENLLRAQPLRERCINGHPFTPDNTYHRPDNGARQCLICRSGARERHQIKRREASWRRHLTHEGECGWARDPERGHVSGHCPTCRAFRGTA